jgi:hypothetical protein
VTNLKKTQIESLPANLVARVMNYETLVNEASGEWDLHLTGFVEGMVTLDNSVFNLEKNP